MCDDDDDDADADDHLGLAGDGRAVSRFTSDGREVAAVGFVLAAGLTEKQRALTLHECFMAAKALLCANSPH